MDLNLIQRSQHGEEEAFEALFHKYKNLVFKTAFLMLESRDEAEDALQEVFVQVYQALPSYDPSKAAFTTWLYRITLNHCLKRRRKRQLSLLAWGEFARMAFTWRTQAPEDGLGEEALQVGLSRLSDKLRPVVIFRYFYEMSYVEIASILDIPVGTVKSRLNLSLKILYKELRNAFPDATIASIKEAAS